jgi:multiple sugar transport system substrate-binding protein
MFDRVVAAAIATLALAAGAARAETITIATHYTDAQRAPLTACLREYERQHPGTTIVHQQSDIDDYLQSVLTARLGGTPPDIYNVYTAWAAQLVDNGVLDEPPAAIAQFVTAGYVPGTVDAIRVGGRFYGIPTEISAYMLLWNKTQFAAAGIAGPPTTWDEVVADAAKLAKHNAAGRLTTAGYAFGPSPANGVHPFLALLASRGVSLLTPDLTGTNLTSPAAVEILEGQRKLFANGSADPAIQVRDFPSGAAAMIIYANWSKQMMRQAFGEKLDETVGVAPIPAGPDWKTLDYGFFWAVDANSPRKQAAWALLQWLNQPHGASGRSCTGDFLVSLGALTGNKADIAVSPEYNDSFSKPFVDAIADGRAVAAPNVLRATEIQQVLRTAIGRAWSGEQTPAAAPTGRSGACWRKDGSGLLTSRRVAPWLFVAPALAFGLLFYGVPILVSFYLSFTDWNPLSLPRWRGLANYAYLLTVDPLFGRTVLNTLVFAVGSTGIGIPLSLLAALGIAASKGRAAWRTIYWLPMVTNVVAVGYAWQYVLDPSYGIVNRLLAGVGVRGPGWLSDPGWAMPSAIAVMTWMTIGHNMLLLAAGLEGIDAQVLDAARSDGASPVQIAVRITLPLLRPAIVFAAVSNLIAGMGYFTLILVLTEGGPEHATDVTALYMYRTAFEQLRMGRAAATAFLLLLVTAALAAVQFRALRQDVSVPP